MNISPSLLQKPIDFETYFQFHKDVVDRKIQVIDKHEKIFDYISSNLERSKWVLEYINLDKKLYNLLHQIQPLKILILTEFWCGDASEIVPVIHSIAEACEQIQVEIYERDTHLELMDLFLTNGGRSIPIIVFLDSNNSVLAKWGPRPLIAQELVLEMKTSNLSAKEKEIKLHQWYRDDETKTTQKEIYEILKQIQEQNESIRN